MISTHILDTFRGVPAEGVSVSLERKEGENWESLGSSKTNSDGRIEFDCPYEKGTYRLNFEIEAYFTALKQEFFFPEVPVIFNVNNTERKYHVPLLLNPYSFSTYRGS